MAKKVSMIPHDEEEEKAANQHLIYMYIFMYNADPLYSDYIMRPMIFIGDWNGHSLDDISLLICCNYLFALLYHVVAVVIGKIFFVGS